MRLIDADNIDYVILEDSLHRIEHKKGDEIDCVIGAEIVQAIPLDKVKQAREEIQEKTITDEIFDEDIFNSTNTDSTSRETAECESYVETEVVKMSDVLEILDKLIAESEEK